MIRLRLQLLQAIFKVHINRLTKTKRNKTTATKATATTTKYSTPNNLSTGSAVLIYGNGKLCSTKAPAKNCSTFVIVH